MANDYISLERLKSSLGIDDNDRDVLLGDVAAAASRWIDRACGRRFWLDPAPVVRTFIPRHRVVVVDGEAGLLVNDIGSDDGLVVEVGAAGAWSPFTDYETGPENALADLAPITKLIRYGGGWGTGRQRVRVTARWGWPETPPEILTAARLLSARIYRRKDSPEGILGSAEWGAIRLSRTDPDVYALIENLMNPSGFA